MSQQMLLPNTWYGTADCVPWENFFWLKNFKHTWCALNLTWDNKKSLPVGYDCYIVSFYTEHIDEQWLQEQCNQVIAPVILLTDWHYYDWKLANNLHCYTYYSLGQQADQIVQWWPDCAEKHIQYKASVICNRISQSKLLAFTKLAETWGLDQLVVALSTWVEEKNVHNWAPSGNPVLDNLTAVFRQKYLGKQIRFDNFNSKPNNQRYNSDPWTKAYQTCALNFTNENFHYSFMGQHTLPGPFISEKTLKCLVGGTAFVAVGQFDTYRTLETLGFKFDYGFNLEWDKDPGNLTRLESIVNIIDVLNTYSAQDLYDMTLASTKHNQDHVLSGSFTKICNDHNRRIAQTIVSQFC
jgi:hypothetical protein